MPRDEKQAVLYWLKYIIDGKRMTTFPPDTNKYVQDRAELALNNLFNKEFSPVEYLWYSARRALPPPIPYNDEQLIKHCVELFTDHPRPLLRHKLEELIRPINFPPYVVIRPLARGSACIEIPREKGGLNYMQSWLARCYDPLKVKNLRSLNVPGLIKGIKDMRSLQIDIIDAAVGFLESMQEFKINPILQVVDLPENGNKHRIPMIPMAACSIAAHWLGELGMSYVHTIMGTGEAGSGARTLIIPDVNAILRSGDALSATDHLDWSQCRKIWKYIVRKIYSPVEFELLEKIDNVIDILFGPHDLIFLGNDNIDFSNYDKPLAFMAPQNWHSYDPYRAPFQQVRKSDGIGECVPDHTNMRSNPKDWRRWYNEVIRFKAFTTQKGCYMCYKVSFPTLCIINDMGHTMASNILGYTVIRMITGDDNSSVVKNKKDADVITNCLERLGLRDNKKKTRTDPNTTLHAEHILKRKRVQVGYRIKDQLEIHPKCSIKVLFPQGSGNHWLTMPREWHHQTKRYPPDVRERGFEYILWKYWNRYDILCKEGICIDWPTTNSIWPTLVSTGPRFKPECPNLFIPDDSVPIVDSIEFYGAHYLPRDVFQINAIGPGPMPRSTTLKMERQLAARYISTLHLTAPTVRSASTRLLPQDIINRVKTHVPNHDTILDPSGEPRAYSIIPSLQQCMTFSISKTTREDLLEHYGPITDVYDGSNILKGHTNYRAIINFLTGPYCPIHRHNVFLVQTHVTKWDCVYVRGNCTEIWYVRDEDVTIKKMVRKNPYLNIHSDDLILREELDRIRRFPPPRPRPQEVKSTLRVIEAGVEYELVPHASDEKVEVHHRTPTPEPRAGKQMCELCEDEFAFLQCLNCKKAYCYECCEDNHKVGSSRSHKFDYYVK